MQSKMMNGIYMKDDENSTISEHQDKLLINRNKKWIPRISDFSKTKPIIYGVGAAHLAGKNGLIKLLRAEG